MAKRNANSVLSNLTPTTMAIMLALDDLPSWLEEATTQMLDSVVGDIERRKMINLAKHHVGLNNALKDLCRIK